METKLVIIESLKSFLSKAAVNPRYKTRPQDFTRERSLTMENVVLMLLSALRRSLDIELVGFFKSAECPTKSAFSQARYKLSTHLFRDWNKCLLHTYYKATRPALKTWKGHILEAVDSSQIHLPDEASNSDIGKTFGIHDTVSMGLAVTCYDVLQNIITHAVLCPFRTNERWVALRWLKNCSEKVIRLYDRGFGSAALMFWHLQYRIPFVMRLKLDFNKQVKCFVESEKKEQTVDFRVAIQPRYLIQHGLQVPIGTLVKVRLIRIKLPNGDVEILATSLYDDQTYPARDFINLYQLRWGVETIFNRLKNVLQLQLFAARKAKGLQQEFQASILLLNLQSILTQDCQQKIENRLRKRKYQYQVNQNLAFGHLKEYLVRLLRCRDAEQLVQYLEKLFVRQLIPVKLHRNIPRYNRSKHKNTKHYTPVNYRKPC
jgi:hypothetical protein